MRRGLVCWRTTQIASLYIYINISISISTYLYIYISMSISMYLDISIYEARLVLLAHHPDCEHISLDQHIYLYLHIHIHLYISLCMYLDLYIWGGANYVGSPPGLQASRLTRGEARPIGVTFESAYIYIYTSICLYVCMSLSPYKRRG